MVVIRIETNICSLDVWQSLQWCYAGTMASVAQDIGGPCLSRPQAVCERSLAALMIENPPISSTSTSTFTFVRSGSLLDASRSPSASGALALFRDGAVADVVVFLVCLLRGVLEVRLEEEDDGGDGGE